MHQFDSLVNVVRVLSFDVSKAFDAVCHEVLCGFSRGRSTEFIRIKLFLVLTSTSQGFMWIKRLQSFCLLLVEYTLEAMFLDQYFHYRGQCH